MKEYGDGKEGSVARTVIMQYESGQENMFANDNVIFVLRPVLGGGHNIVNMD